MHQSRVLVTGGAGFLASHIILQLLHRGYQVRVSAPDPTSTKLDYLRCLHPRSHEIDVIKASCMSPLGWTEAVEDCDYIIHTASPFANKMSDDGLIKAVLRSVRYLWEAILRQEKRPKKVILSSTLGSIVYGHDPARYQMPLTEDDWSKESNCSAFIQAKKYAEVRFQHLSQMDRVPVAIINCACLCGPVLSPHHINAESSDVLLHLLEGGGDLSQNVSLPVVDVRDAAKLHILAIERCRGSQNRYIAVADDAQSTTLLDISAWLTVAFSDESDYRPVTRFRQERLRRLKNTIVPSKRLLLCPGLTVSNVHAKEKLSMAFRSAQISVQDQVHSLFRLCAIDPKGYPLQKYALTEVRHQKKTV